MGYYWNSTESWIKMQERERERECKATKFNFHATFSMRYHIYKTRFWSAQPFFMNSMNKHILFYLLYCNMFWTLIFQSNRNEYLLNWDGTIPYANILWQSSIMLHSSKHVSKCDATHKNGNVFLHLTFTMFIYSYQVSSVPPFHSGLLLINSKFVAKSMPM